jgi:lipopolysaccharide export system permease protein
MWILDRYIIRQFLTNFAILLIVFLTLYVIGDMVIDLDEFVQAGQARADARGGSAFVAMLQVMVDFYGPMIAMVYSFCSGVIVVGAMGFTYSNMARSREMIAVLASGINMYRIAMPILVVGCLLNFMTIVNQELIIAPLAQQLTRDKSQLKNMQSRRSTPILFAADSKGDLISASDFDKDQRTLTDITILDRDDRGRVIRRVNAARGTWNQSQQGWDLTDGSAMMRTAPVEGEDRLADPSLQEAAFFATDLSPLVIQARNDALYPRLLSFNELRTLRDNPALQRSGGKQITQIMHARFSLIVMNVLVLATGMPFFLRREPGQMFITVVRATCVCLGAWTVGLLLLQLGGTINPVIAAWLPVVIYLPLSAVMMQFVRT